MHLLDFIFPKRCLRCGRLGQYFCTRCTLTIRVVGDNEHICPVCEKLAIGGATHPKCQTRYTIDGLTTFFRYDGIIRNAIKSIKYRYVSDLAQEFISLIPPASLHQLTNVPAHRLTSLIPVPLHTARQRERGFNQAEVLGKLLSVRLGIPIEKTFLKRVKKTIPQVEMKKREARLKNMTDVFAIHHLTIKPSNHFIFLFDDVFTTGATLRSAASVLKHAGVQYVWGITIAR